MLLLLGLYQDFLKSGDTIRLHRRDRYWRYPSPGGTTFVKVCTASVNVPAKNSGGQQRIRGVKKNSGFRHGGIQTPLRPKDPSAWSIDLSELLSAVCIDLRLDQDHKYECVHSC